MRSASCASGVMGKITTVGIDLAKSVFSVHAVDENGVVLVRKTVSRARLAAMVAQWPVCLIGMEACSGLTSGREDSRSSGTRCASWPRGFVAPYRKNGKNDGNDAEAIREAVGRPNMRFVPVKSTEQQTLLTLHRVRQGFVEERTATGNRMRGLLAEFGVVLPRKRAELLGGPLERIVRRQLDKRSTETGYHCPEQAFLYSIRTA